MLKYYISLGSKRDLGWFGEFPHIDNSILVLAVNCCIYKHYATYVSKFCSFVDICVRGTRTQPLICVGCSVHYWISCAIKKGGFFEIAFVVVDTHLLGFEALAYVLPHFDELTHMVIHVSSAQFIFAICLRKVYTICACQGFFESSKAFNTRSNILLWIKPLYSHHGSSLSLHFGKCLRLLVHTSMKPGCLARRPLCHKVNLRPSCHKVNSPRGVAARRPLCHTK